MCLALCKVKISTFEFQASLCSRVCVWRNGVITTLANESTLWLDALRSGITMPGLVVQSPGWAVSTLLHWRQITVLLVGNAVPIGLTSVQNTGDRVAVKGRQEKLTHELLKAARGRADI